MFKNIRGLNSDKVKEEYFSAAGNEGWEYCGVDQYGYYVFKRGKAQDRA